MKNRSERLIEIDHITKEYKTSAGSFRALDDVTLGIDAGQLVAVTGKSGSGKSTMLNMITGIDKPTRGSVRIGGRKIELLSEDELASWRGRTVGIVFQFFQLIPTLTIAENVMLPMDFCNTYGRKERRERALFLLGEVGIPEQADKFPASLSGGQQQRAAIARALANDPPIIIADEPTGNLDSHTAESIYRLFTRFAGLGKTIIVVTHEKEYSSYFSDSVALSDGRIAGATGVDTEANTI